MRAQATYKRWTPAGLLLLLLVMAAPARSADAPADHETVSRDTARKVKRTAKPLLDKYCKDACKIIDVSVELKETIGDLGSLGFESVAGDSVSGALEVEKVTLDIQVDERVSEVNRERLGRILTNGLTQVTTNVDVLWSTVTLPQIGQSASAQQQLKRRLRTNLSESVDRVITTYCPESCVLSKIAVDGRLVTPDEASAVPEEQLVRSEDGQAILRIETADLDVVMDRALPESDRRNIENMIEAKTAFAEPVDLAVSVAKFPESYATKQERQDRQSEDPYGLGKLRRTLEIFRDLAGTKEVIRRTETETSRVEETAGESAGDATPPWMWALYGGIFLVVAGLIVALIMRVASASRDAQYMMRQAQNPGPPGGEEAREPSGDGGGGPGGEALRSQMSQKLQIEDLRKELVETFRESPRVAKETFARLLQEEGVEETAKYVHLFGHLVVFELLGDPNLQRDLYELSEYYHTTRFEFTPQEELELLKGLKTRVTAGEIRVLAQQNTDKFDFLSKLDATQIYNLISDEKPRVQSIVLTQLDHRRRRAVFDMYVGEAKVELMRELCRAEAIPKEYLANVAQALHRKVTSRPEFDTENLRSHDILLDLLEKAGLEEQRALMAKLQTTNSEAARGIKLRLVTVEILPYLKDGHLLEIVLGLEREDLLTFLAGAPEHIRELLLAKSPEELAESWLEELEDVGALDEQAYRMVEIKLTGKIRALANNGTINLLDINDRIFGSQTEADEDAEMALSDSREPHMIA